VSYSAVQFSETTSGSPDPVGPVAWLAVPMSDCDNEDPLGFNPVMHKKREPGNEVAPHSTRPDGPHFGSPLDHLQSRADLPNKLGSETVLLFFVIEDRFPEFGFRFVDELNRFHAGEPQFHPVRQKRRVRLFDRLPLR
jgi:hypothetical protein